MVKYILFLILFASGIENNTTKIITNKNSPENDSILSKSAIRYDLLKQDMLSADSIILFSHHSPNMPIKNPKTGEYYKESIPFIEQGNINYTLSVQERKQLNKKEIEELTDILIIPAVDDSINTTCFQPRNAVAIFKGNIMSCFDFCFECYGFSTYGNFRSDLIMNPEKYLKLLVLYKKYGFKYEIE